MFRAVENNVESGREHFSLDCFFVDRKFVERSDSRFAVHLSAPLSRVPHAAALVEWDYNVKFELTDGYWIMINES